MKKFLLFTLIFSGIYSNAFSQAVKLTAIYDANNSAVKLNWNMVNSQARTSYLLLRSADGISWTEAAKDRMLRKYTDEDIYFFNDRLFSPGKNFYRIKIADSYNNTIALSPIVVVYTKGAIKPASTYSPGVQQQTVKQNNKQQPLNTDRKSTNNSWIIYPNPARNFLQLTYKGTAELKGVIHVQIQDANGKIVVKFRSGSMYKTLQIPISNLQKGAYFIQVNMLNEIMMSRQFIKQ